MAASLAFPSRTRAHALWGVFFLGLSFKGGIRGELSFPPFSVSFSAASASRFIAAVSSIIACFMFRAALVIPHGPPFSHSHSNSPPPPCTRYSEYVLSQIRREIGMTQVEVANKLHIAQPTYAAFERSDNLRVGTLSKIVSAFGGVLKFQVEIDGRDYPLGFATQRVAMV